MSVKHILLPLNGEPNDHVALAALRLAKQCEAHVSAGYEDALGPLYARTAGFIPSGPVYGDFYDQMQRLRADRLALARRQFDKAVGVTHVPVVSAPTCRQASCMWVSEANAGSLSERGLITDLAVAAAPGASMSPASWSLVETLLFALRAPVLLIPEKTESADFWRPMIAWNGSGESLRALQRAMPLFPADAEPVLLQIGKPSAGRIPASRAAEYLGWHCFAADVKQIDAKESDAPKIILDQAASLEASCVVMGAYTHGRTRQLLLGGLTDFMLRGAPLPVLMSH